MVHIKMHPTCTSQVWVNANKPTIGICLGTFSDAQRNHVASTSAESTCRIHLSINTP